MSTDGNRRSASSAGGDVGGQEGKMVVARSLEEAFEFCLECFLLQNSGVITQHYAGSILLQGPPKVGKSMFCRNFVRRTEEIRQPLVYVCTDEEPDQLLRGLGSTEGKEDGIRIVDCYTWRSGEKAKEGIFAASSADLTDLSITMQKAIEDLERPNVVVDSISSIALDGGEDTTLKWLRNQIPRLRLNRCFGLFTVSEGVHSPNFLNALRTLFDSIIEMKIEESPHGLDRFVRIFATKAESPVGGGWTSFKVTEKGIIIGTTLWKIKTQLEDSQIDLEKLINYYRIRGILRKTDKVVTIARGGMLEYYV